MAAEEFSEIIAEVACRLKSADRVLFITGAGVSAESGLPTYRGVGGLYNRQQTEEGVPIEAALSGRMFAAYPELTWKYLWEIGAACVGAEPNAAHRFMAELESDKAQTWVLTQNVDGLHRAAGSVNLVEVHGRASDLFCAGCRKEFTASDLLGGFQSKPVLPPVCRECGAVVRPNVVLFEEALPQQVCESLERLAGIDFDVVLAIGTSAVFPYIAQPFAAASYRGRMTVEINPCETEISDFASHRLSISAAEAAEWIGKTYRST